MLLGSAENAEVEKGGIGKFGRNGDKTVNGQRRSGKNRSVEICWHITPAEYNKNELKYNNRSNLLCKCFNRGKLYSTSRISMSLLCTAYV